jgi:hypothetical protein
MPDQTPLDAKPDAAAPSPAVDAKPNTPPEAPSPSVDAKPTEKPWDEQAADATIQKHPSIPTPPPVEAKPDSSLATPPGQEAAPAASGDVSKSNKTPDPKTVDGESFAHLPFHEHQDFKKLVAERKELRETVANVRPLAERQQVLDTYCQANGITSQQFRDVMEITALINTNPAEARRRLKPTLDYLDKFEGTALPPDLQQQVEAGTVPLEIARRLAAAEQQKTFVQQRSQASQDAARQQMVTQTLTQWEQQMMVTDPDYARKQDFVNNTFVALSAMEPWQTPDQALALAKKAYDQVNKRLGVFIPRAPVTKVLESNGSAVSRQVEEPITWEGVDAAMVRKFAR